MTGTGLSAGQWLASLAALVLPGLLARALARRHGIGVLWAALATGGVLAVVGIALTRTPDPARQLTIMLVLLPGFVSLVLGAAVGVLAGRR